MLTRPTYLLSLQRRLVFAAVLVALLGACKPKTTRDRSERQESLVTLAKELGVTFPTEAKLIVARRERGADDLLAVKVELSASDWPAFLARSPIDPSLFRPGERGLLGPDDAAWDPNQAKHLRTAETRLSPSRVLNLGYDDSHEGIVMVYLVSHGL